MPNRLASEPSPYLRQHGGHPVDWYPWGAEAFGRARAEDRPVLLSVGYSTCHWCHVMAHESFEDPAIARLMNERFVCIKVDREERPEIDAVYQQAQALGGEPGGWPLTMFLTPDGVPFFGGTYFPPHDLPGRPAFARLLTMLADAYQTRRGEVTRAATEMRQGLAAALAARPAAAPARLPPDLVERAAVRLAAHLDRRLGGFAPAPKFPCPSALEVLERGARRLARAGDAAADGLDTGLRLTLTRMAEGGMYDQLGGGFARYATDAAWVVPHFEKMLYDNAQLLALYARGWRRYGDPLYARVVRETAAYLERELRSPEGGLYTAQDADAAGVEGAYYVWTPAQVRAALEPAAAALVGRVYDVTEGGNWHDPYGHGPAGASVLHVAVPPATDEERHALAAARVALVAARRRRVPPATDDKILAGLNGLAIAGLAEAGRLLDDPALVAGARRTAEFVLGHLVGPDGELRRTFGAGTARLPGTLDDHAFAAHGLLALHEATGEARWFDEARRLTDVVLTRFYDPATRTLWLVGPDEPDLIERPASLHDGAVPSGLSVTLRNLVRLEHVLGRGPGEACYGDVAEVLATAYGAAALENPFAFAGLLGALDLYLEGAALRAGPRPSR